MDKTKFKDNEVRLEDRSGFMSDKKRLDTENIYLDGEKSGSGFDAENIRTDKKKRFRDDEDSVSGDESGC